MRSSLYLLACLVLSSVSATVARAQCAAIPDCGSCPNPTICDDCDSGRFFVVPPGGSPTCQVCTTCGVGEVEISACSDFIDRQCAAECPAGTIQNGAVCDDCGVFDCAVCSAPGTCTACADGYFLDAGDCVPCTTCDPGNRVATACSGTQDTVCAQCSAGTYSEAPNSPTCTPCAAGTFAANAGASSCADCPAGESSQAGQTACDCAAGTMGTSGSCTQCAAGSFSDTIGSAVCTECMAGTYSNAGSMSCTACDPGSYSGVGASACTSCLEDTVAASAGSAACMSCEFGSVANAAGTACEITCGDGAIGGDETCDDLNTFNGDGCSSTCSIEMYWVCSDAPSHCVYNPPYMGRPSHGCNTAGDEPPPLSYFGLFVAVAYAVWRRFMRA